MSKRQNCPAGHGSTLAVKHVHEWHIQVELLYEAYFISQKFIGCMISLQ